MKLTKKLEAEILKVYDAYWNAYLKGDMKTFASMLDDNITIFGTAVSEVFTNKKETVSFYKATADQMTGKAEFRNRQISMQPVDNTVVITEQNDLYILIEKDWTFYGHVRVTAVFQQSATGWKLVHQHASFPDSRAEEGEQVAADKIKEENLQLREAVKRRTIELENKNRELEIEASLERVRAVAMGMKQPDDLLEVAKTQYNELKQLGFTHIRNALIGIFNDAKNYFTDYDYSDFSKGSITPIPYNKNKVIDRSLKQMKSATDAFTEFIVKGKELEEWKAFRKLNGEYDDSRIGDALYYYFYSIHSGNIGLSTFKRINKEQLDILKRFRNVFDLAYKRYVDITNAEAQAREAEIELALERVRARTMAMQNSNELPEAANLLFQQIQVLGMPAWSAGYCIWDDDLPAGGTGKKAITLWMSSEGVLQPPFKAPATEDELFIQMRKGQEEGKTFHVVEMGGDKLVRHYQYMRTLPVVGEILDSIIEAGHPLPTFQIMHHAYFSKGFLLFITYDPVPDAHDIFKRFGKVFDQTYTRFLDLQNAEAQAREAAIELGLERVRARAMAMHKSDELAELVDTVFQELTKLGFALDRFLIMLFDDATSSSVWWVSNAPAGLFVEYHQHKPYKEYIKNWKARTPGWQYLLAGEEKKEWGDYIFENTELSLLPAPVKNGMRSVKQVYLNAAFHSFGSLTFSTVEPITDNEFAILLRFAAVFNQTYTRFLDLQKAEVQARESQIQLALERVRSRTMAMQNSIELAEVSSLLFQQMKSLGVNTYSSGFTIWDNNKDLISWMCNADGSMNPPFTMPIAEDAWHIRQYESWKNGEDFILKDLKGEDIQSYFRYLRSFPLLDEAFGKSIAAGHPMPERQVHNVANFSHGNLLFITLEPCPEAHDIFKRFAKVFEQTYTRFLDLQKAEAHAREAHIEAALEKVRSRSLAMQKSEELKEVIQVVYEQFVHLNVNTEHAGFVIDYTLRDDRLIWVASKHGVPSQLTIPYFDSEYYNSFNEAKKKGLDFFATNLSFEDKNSFYRELFKYIPGLPEEAKEFYFSCPGLAISTILLENIGLYIENFEGIPYSDEDNAILMRFGKVFQQTYTRFLDLQKAEAQAREAQIETALERVRSRTMSMQKSTELQDTAMLLVQQVKILGVPSFACGFNIWDDDRKADTAWMAGEDRLQPPFKTSSSEDVFLHIHEAAQRGESLFVAEQGGEVLETHYRYMATIPEFKAVMDKMAEAGLSVPTFQIIHCAFFSQGYLMFISFEPVPEAHDIFKRFAKVFEQTYTRFLDLQKAEAQARESQIQLALERVRARTMAMQKSDELSETAVLLFHQLMSLELNVKGCGFNIWEKDEKTCTSWMSGPDGELSPPFQLPLMIDPLFIRYYESRQKGEDFWVYETDKEKLANRYAYLSTLPVFGDAITRELEAGKEIPDFVVDHVVNFSQGNLIFITYEHCPDAWDIFKRFGKVFEQTYTRFLDLQKAEAQARQAKIEAAMEKVRSRAMAMQKPNELVEVAELLRNEMGLLGVEELETSSIYIHHEETGKIECWYAIRDVAHPEKKLMSDHMIMNLNETWVGRQMLDFYRSGKKQISISMKGDNRKEWINYCADHSKVLVGYYGDTIPDRTYHLYKFTNGYMGAASPGDISAESWDLLQRATSVFSLAYTRFNDLQQAEAQAREAKIEAALERVRSRTLAMQKSDELAETAAVLFQQLIALGIEPNRLYISIIKSELGETEFWITDEDGSKVSTAFDANMNDNTTFLKMYEGWKQQQKSLVIDMQGEELQNYFRHLTNLGVPFKGGLEQKKRVQDIAYFSKGFIGMASPEEQPAETLVLLERFAAVFNLTFTRFNDLKIAEAHAQQAEQDLIAIKEAKQKAEEALTELQSTQKQLIQSEKMASLGELTAGIAHEIQNPLNFVNNFSEVSNELIDEMVDEVKKGNAAEAAAIANDIKQNLEKISHHGKRADAIVKGMLQHSRSSSGVKEPTDINALADEYLRLAYHGLRAKDKSFNANLKTDYDQSIGNINIIPQDIGRAVLNLITNAFYAVDEKKKQRPGGYEPTVSVSTKKTGDKVLISVKDNGNGIPQKILDKIFQPFFTTKPTGQGTGLGLSLSYDIIKVHGGELKVETNEGEGSKFIIQLRTN